MSIDGARPQRKLTRRELLGSAAGAGLLALAARARSARAAARPPNLVIILSDNHRWDAMACAGHPFVRTPQMDRLAREGLLFENAFCTTPLCSPARASFLTGLYAWRHGVRTNAKSQSSWSEAHTTFFELLEREAGYANGFFGKWHMPGSGQPALRGVERFVTFTIEDGQGRYYDCPLVVDGRDEPSRKPYLSEELTDRALDFAAERRSGPFCLYLSHKAVHHPWKPAPEDVGIYADAPVELPRGANSWTGYTNGEIFGGFDRPIESAMRVYLETVTSLDREIGRLLAGLDARGLLEGALVVYASDNGFLFGEHRHVELRWPFEEVIRIPWLLRAPRLVAEPGRRVPQLALNIDLAPTLLELAGVSPPASMQGMSLAPWLRGSQAPGRRAFLVENSKEFPYSAPTYRGVRTRRHLYVEFEGRHRPTLHDVAADPRQERDLMGTPEGERALAELRPMLAALLRGERLDD